MNDILIRTWVLLKGNWILLSILILETLVMLVFKGGQVGLTPNLFQEMALYFFHLAVLGGWLYQMKTVILHPNHRTGWDDFFNGVARYARQLIGGGAMFMLVCLLGGILALGVAGGLAGPPDMKLMDQIWQLLQANKMHELEVLMQQQSAAFQQLEQWLASFLAGLALLGLYTMTLCFWTHWCVLADSSWIRAWSRSQQILRKHWKPLLWLGMIWAAPTLLIHVGILSGISALAILAFFLSLLAKTYFTLLFCLFLCELEPADVAPLLAPTAPPKP